LPLIHAFLVGDVANFITVIRIEMAFESGEVNDVFLFIAFVRNAPLSIVAISNALPLGLVPEKTGARRRNRMIVVLVSIVRRIERFFGVSRVGCCPQARYVVGGCGGHRPQMAVRTDITIHKEVVEQNEIARQSMVIRSDSCAKQNKPRIAVT